MCQAGRPAHRAPSGGAAVLRAELRKNRLTSFCSDEHAQSLVLGDFVYDRADTLYDGIAGDVLSGGLKLTPERLDLFAHRDFEVLARHLSSENGERR